MSALYGMFAGSRGAPVAVDDDFDGFGGLDDDELGDEFMAAGMAQRGGGMSAAAAQEVYTKKLIHKEFYNDFTDDCDEDDLE